MSVLVKRSTDDITWGRLLPARGNGTKAVTVTPEDAFRQSAVWAALSLRADLMSSFPIDTFRKYTVTGIGELQQQVPKPAVLVNPQGGQSSMREWMYSTQIDLDRVGNCYGLIRQVDAVGKPAVIELVAHETVTVRVRDDIVTYVIKGKTYDAHEVWHEKQYTIPGLVMGLSPIAAAAWSLGLWKSAAEFAADWFTNHGNIPSGHLRNTKKTLADVDADKIKARYKVAVEGGDIFVTGNDWEFKTETAASAEARFLEQQGYSDAAVARFLGVPGDMIDVATKGQSITYANITQRNLQFLITKMGPAVGRREDALSSLLPAPRFVKLNTAALLRMDPETTSRILINEVQGMITAPSEARALMNRAPFTPEQIEEFKQLGIIGAGTPAPAITVTSTNGA